MLQNNINIKLCTLTHKMNVKLQLDKTIVTAETTNLHSLLRFGDFQGDNDRRQTELITLPIAHAHGAINLVNGLFG